MNFILSFNLGLIQVNKIWLSKLQVEDIPTQKVLKKI